MHPSLKIRFFSLLISAPLIAPSAFASLTLDTLQDRGKLQCSVNAG